MYDTTDAGVSLPAASITTSSLSQSYAHLLIVYYGISDQSSMVSLNVQFNADSSSHYYYNDFGNTTGSVSGTASSASISMPIGWLGLSSGYTGMGGFFLLPGYSANVQHGGAGLAYQQTAGTPVFELSVFGGMWTQASHITTMTFIPSAGNIKTGRITVYGLVG